MPIERSETMFGVTFEEVRKLYKEQERKRLEIKGKTEIEENKSINRDDFIYVPSIDLHFAKQRTHLGLNWYDTHKKLHQENLLMPTIPQFLEFIKYLKEEYQDKNEAEEILDDILNVRNPWRSNWLDADFKVINKKLNINYNHRTINGNLQPLNLDPLEKCLMENCYADVLNPNAQGFPTKKLIKSKGGIYFYYPIENSVAGFYSGSIRSGLGCFWDPDSSVALLGVFASAEDASRKI